MGGSDRILQKEDGKVRGENPPKKNGLPGSKRSARKKKALTAGRETRIVTVGWKKREGMIRKIEAKRTKEYTHHRKRRGGNAKCDSQRRLNPKRNGARPMKTADMNSCEVGRVEIGKEKKISKHKGHTPV